MKKQYHKALVIGKFQPLHKGHLALIDYAALQVEKVAVCVTAHDREIISIDQRIKWLTESYDDNPSIIVRGVSYDPDKLNESSVSDMKSSEEWADYLKGILDDFSEIDVIIGSEMYVKFMADYIGIDHLIYDEHRTNLNISATDIKGDIIRYWDYLSPAAKRTYVKHICICGSESTGKSTTCKRLEEEYGFITMIPEIGRCLVGKSEICATSTLKKIFSIHNDLLRAVIHEPPTPIILWDTDNITTLSYFTYLNPKGTVDEIKCGKDILKADKYFFFESNIPVHDDGTRFDSDEALKLRDHHLKMYDTYEIETELISIENRCDIVREYILSEIRSLKKVFGR